MVQQQQKTEKPELTLSSLLGIRAKHGVGFVIWLDCFFEGQIAGSSDAGRYWHYYVINSKGLGGID